LFRASTGFSPTDFFLRLKIQKASQKLLASRAPIREVAREVGFEDEYYFSRLFRKITGESPRRYRESHRA
ncbi:MAG: helix-turn-helix domain-containing protein, partial [Spirochaetia bacterium]|nr:helix-turn-helix domain-containing protein [Spirochaetia bacterium]